MAYTVVNLDNMAGTKVESKLVSVKYFNGANMADIENGRIVLLGDLFAIAGQREVFKGTAPVATSPRNKLALIASPEYMVDERKLNYDEFINTKDPKDVARGYLFEDGDMFSLTVEGFDVTPTVGDIVEVAASTVLKVVETLTANSTKIGEIIDIYNDGTKTFYTVRVG